MLRFLKRLILILLILVVVAVGAGVGLFYLTPSKAIASRVADAVREQTGRELKISGDIKRALLPNLSVEVQGVELSNADWAGKEPMLQAKRASVKLRVAPLLWGAIEIEELIVEEPILRLTRAKDGRANWELGADKESETDKSGSDSRSNGKLPLIIDARLTGGRILFDDRAGGQKFDFADIALAAKYPKRDGALEASGDAKINGAPAKFTARVEKVAAALAGAPSKALLKLDTAGLKASIDLAASQGDKAKTVATLDLTLDGAAKETAWLRALLPPAYSELGAVDAKGKLDVSDAAFKADLAVNVSLKGRKMALKAVSEAGAGWKKGLESIDADLSLTVDGLAALSYDGKIALPDGEKKALGLNGAYSADISDAKALLAWAGAAAPADSPAAKISTVKLTGAVEISPKTTAASAKGAVGYDRRDVSIDIDAKSGARWMSGDPIKLSIKSASAKLFDLSWNGSITFADAAPAMALKHLEGDLSFASTAVRELTLWAGAGPIEAPKGKFETASMKMKLLVADEKVALSGLEAKIDDVVLNGEIDLDRPKTGRMKLNAKLKAGDFDLRPFTPASKTSKPAASTASGEKGWSDEEFQLGSLKLLDADIRIEAAGLTTNVVRFTDAVILATLQDGKLSLSVEKMALYGGAAKGKVVLDASPATPKLDVDLDLGGVALRPFLKDAAKMDWLAGTGALKADIATSGKSMRQMMKALAGTASIDLRDGAIIGYNLAALARNVTSLGTATSEDRKTDFASITASFTLKDGVADNKDLDFQGPLVRMSGEGVINIGGRTVDYLAKPKAVATLKGQGGATDLSGVTFPIRIKGPWENPSVSPELGSALTDVTSIPTSADKLGASLSDAFSKKGDGGLRDKVGGAIDALTGGDKKDGEQSKPAIPGLPGGLFGN
ncbi:MAG: AsmA family protein [Neomegalonema sp.]|nr:AsmA family protein [Neomegalonema sp.]